MIDVGGPELTAIDREVLAHPLVGGVLLSGRNFIDRSQLRALTDAIHKVRSPAPLIAVDQEGGRLQSFVNGFSALPPLRRIGHAYETEAASGLAMARALGWLMAAELLACGIDFSLAPCVDLDYGLSELIGDRSFHARAEIVANLAVAYAHGMRDAGMAATAGHFPGHGAVVADSHVALPVDRRPLEDLEGDLLPYRRLIANGLPAILMAHVQFLAVDPAPASFSARWIGRELRQGLQFAGLVIADDLSMAAAAAVGTLPDRALRALQAGCDVIPVCDDRPGVEHLLDRFHPRADPAAQLRLIRMRGRRQSGFETLEASAGWRSAREWLARSAAKPELKFEPAEGEAGGD
jgi:beta-N-acetylhexosaminidase